MKKKLSVLNEKGASKWIWLAVAALVAMVAAVALPVLNRARLQERTAMEQTSKVRKIPIVVPTSMTPKSDSAARPEVAPVPGAITGEDEQGASGAAPHGGTRSFPAENGPDTAAVIKATEASHASGSDSEETEVRALPAERDTAVPTAPMKANANGPTYVEPPPLVPPMPQQAADQAIKAPPSNATSGTSAAAAAPGEPAEKDETADETLSETAPFSVQLGAFHGRANAERLVTRMNEGGYSAFIVEKNGATDQMLYIVRSGHYATQDEAERAATVIWEKENLDGIVIKDR